MFVEEIYWKIKLPLSPYKPGRAETVEGALSEIHLNNCICFKIKWWGQSRGGNSRCTVMLIWFYHKGCATKKQTNQKIKSKNNRNVASYLKACKLAIISLCHHNQELNRSTQASNNNIYKFSMGNLFFFSPFPRRNGFLVLRNSSIYSTEILKLLLKVIFNITFLQISVGEKKEKKYGLHSNSNI